MRKLEDRTSYYAEANRLAKAEALAEVIRKECGSITQSLVDALPTQSHEWWVSLAKAAMVHPPSPATCEAVVGILGQEVELRFDHPKDVLEGLPR